jgi:cell division protein FtsL
MMDYKSRYPSIFRARQRITRRESAGGNPEGRQWFWRTTGMVVSLAVAVGMVISMWFGYRISNSLDELAIQQQIMEHATERNRLLKQQQEQLLSEERLQKAVRERGLKPPTAEQIKRM